MMVEVTILLLVLIAALAIYAVLGGADFGAGVWEVNTAFKSNKRERELLYHAIGPVWETNHVWLIFILVILFGAFPTAFQAINSALFVPMLLALVGIVFRGAAYAFRSQLKENPVQNRIWTIAFGLSSVLAPFFLGMTIGALASGELEFSEQVFVGNHLTGWINLLSVFVGFFTVGLCVYTSATYMIRESRSANEPELEELWRRRALGIGVLMGVLAAAGLVIALTAYPGLGEGLMQRGWPWILVSLLGGVYSLVAIKRSWNSAAAVAVSITCAAVVIGWGFAQYPDLVPDAFSATESASPKSVLRLILIATAIGSTMLVPAIWLLFKIFKSDSIEGSQTC